jgi:fumarylacetoacetate (FAA) hydrolase
MRLARWLDPSGVVYIGSAEGDELTPLAAADPARPDEAMLTLAVSTPDKPAPIGQPASRGAVRLLPPIARPGVLRDFLAFADHFRGAGHDIPDGWYDIPTGYYGNPHNLIADNEIAPYPATDELDYELEVAVVLGRDVSNVTVEQAHHAIAGYTIFNDWSARDIQRRERALGAGGPTHAKDFASSLGPVLATPDEMLGVPGAPHGSMIARVNGTEYSRGDLKDMHYSFAELISYLSRDTVLRRGDVLGSGTCGGGCILELSRSHGSEAYPWLTPGDRVELEVNGIGRLSNTVGPRRAAA